MLNSFLSAQESERMRVFNSAMMLSDVLAERDNQIKIKEELDRLNRIRELKYDEMGKHNHERMLQREEAEHKERLHKKLEVARVQREQLSDAVEKRRAEIESNKREGFLMRMEYQKQLQDDALDATASKDREIRAMRECQKAQEYLKELKVREKNAASRLDQKIQEHAQKQDEIQLKRKQREKFVFEQKQKIRQDMIDRQATRLAEMRDQADERIQQQCKDAVQAQDRIEFERKEYFNERLRDVQDDRRKAIQRKEQHVIAEISREKEATEYMKLLQAKFEEEDTSVNMTRQRVENQTREYLLSQIREKQAKHDSEAARVSKTRETGAKIEKAQYDEFQDYAEAVIRDYAECGRNVMPMINVLKGYKPE